VGSVSFVISGLLVGVMIGISLYGSRILPPDARVPLHLGPGGYGSFASKNIGLIVFPVAGVVILALLTAVSAHAIKANHGGSGAVSLIILPIALVVIVCVQWGAIAVARRNTTIRSDQ
jgi:hypothetical protein